MVNNPFDDENGSFSALVNAAGQYSLWPSFAPVPPGWTVAFGVGTRAECLDFIERSWADLRPAALLEPTAGAS